MNNDAQATETAAPVLPRAKPFDASPSTGATPKGMQTAPRLATPAGSALVPEGQDHSGVFQHLVTDDSDIAGLVAYSIYKQNKLDWLRAFQAAQGRAPNDAELTAYIIGEGTPRRIATYRHLAEATLSGNGPTIADGRDVGAPFQRRRPALADRGLFSPGLVAAYVLIGVLFVLGFWLALHFTLTSR